MNLQTHIPQGLWDAVASAYKAESFSHAILESIYYLSSMIRDRAGVDGDGAALVGQALGGESPRLKLNALQTESERDMQKGYEHILRGIYTGIRNPRSHEQSVDTKVTADAVIHFIGHIVTLLSASKEAFTVEAFLERVADSEFVETKRYAELIVSEVPKLRLGDAAVGLYRNRQKIDLRKHRYLIHELLAAMSPNQASMYVGVVSEELRGVNDDGSIRSTLQMLTPQMWPTLSEVSRVRIENKLIRLIAAGEAAESGRTSQALATWSNDFVKYFSLREEAVLALIRRLESSDAAARRYVARYFLRSLPEAVSNSKHVSARCIKAIVAAVKADDDSVTTALINWVDAYPAEWQAALVDGLKDKTNPENPAVRFSDGTPFLTAPPRDEFDDDIPF